VFPLASFPVFATPPPGNDHNTLLLFPLTS
jgi:hypothetical protein